jgi:hypothetical protein
MPKNDASLFNGYTGKKLEALLSIRSARKTGIWINVTDTNLAYYYIVMHEKILGRELPHEKMRTGINAKNFKDNFLDIHTNLTRDKVADCIDRILADYTESTQKEPAYKDLLTFRALGTVWKVQCSRIISAMDDKITRDFERENDRRRAEMAEFKEKLKNPEAHNDIF